MQSLALVRNPAESIPPESPEARTLPNENVGRIDGQWHLRFSPTYNVPIDFSIHFTFA